MVKKANKTKKIINTSGSNNKTNYFITQSRLNRGQRKYCHCIMKLRSSKTRKAGVNPYPVCRKIGNDFAIQFKKEMKLKKGDYNPMDFDVSKTNCVMNYDYSKYDLKDIQAFCQEKGIPITYTTKSSNNKTVKYYAKGKLVEKLIKHYLNKQK